ncbi:adenine deaminase [Scopulibacillus darangshiensis]|uniref:Adenine deaminase n=1 Tax=Scopulibacillus darangshiensis TaxID=442528 RepID=A0A4R2NSR0_9BACL|nr:adenine deaminase [Scopulibacillus darangshiensis]TCP24514.1 adenine deaminase [Scopulibacillus darangshiensis]
MAITKDRMKRRIAVAGKKKKADLVIKNGKIVDVFNGGMMEADIAVTDGYIVGIGNYEGLKTIDAKGKIISPALIDGHVHIESSMLTPKEFAKVLIPHGVTTAVTDPHEIANVAGEGGIRYMLDDAVDCGMDIYTMLPSSVPATAYENNGARLDAEDLEPFYHHKNVLGLAEVMDYPAVMNASDQILEKLLVTFKHSTRVDGHAAGLDADAINVYKAAGIQTDHECVSINEAKDRLSRGMYVMIREGSVPKDLRALIGLVNDRNARRFLFCTDDKHTDDLIEEGSVDHNIRMAVKLGLDPVTAIQMASLNAAECYHLKNKGAIAPGYEANFLVLDDLNTFQIKSVYQKGRLVSENGALISESQAHQADITAVSGTINIPDVTANDLNITLGDDTKAHIIEIVPNSLVTNHVIDDVPTIDGSFTPSAEIDLLKMTVIERHKGTGNIGLGIVKGLHITSGAMATTVAHDSHNLVVAGMSDEDMLIAIEEIKKINGGMVVVKDGRVIACLPLPIAGLISDQPNLAVNEKLRDIHHALTEVGASSAFNPFLTLSFLCLPVIPEIKLTDKGLFDVTSFQHIDIVEKEKQTVTI